MDSNSQWDRAQKDWSQWLAAKQQVESRDAGFFANHRREMESGRKHWEPVEDEPMPDYDGGDGTVSYDC